MSTPTSSDADDDTGRDLVADLDFATNSLSLSLALSFLSNEGDPRRLGEAVVGVLTSASCVSNCLRRPGLDGPVSSVSGKLDTGLASLVYAAEDESREHDCRNRGTPSTPSPSPSAPPPMGACRDPDPRG